MTTKELDKKIAKVAEATGQTKQQVADKLFARDGWTHFLVNNA